MLQACPRCTQLLPADAVFCRRCGAEIGRAAPLARTADKKRMSLLTPLLAAVLVAGLIFSGSVFMHVPQQLQTVQPAASSSSATYNNVPIPPVYPEPVNSEIPLYAPVIVGPVYPNRSMVPMREDPMNHHHESKR